MKLMAKRELIDRNNLESTTIVTDDYSGNEVLDVVLMEDVIEAPVITEQEIVKPYLDKIRSEIWDLQYGDEEKSETDEDRADAYNNAIRQVIEIIDEYMTESEE